jgi:hypothetical protein
MQTRGKKPGTGSRAPSQKIGKAKSKKSRDDAAQSRRFIEAANEAEADQEDASAADSVMERMAAKPPKPHN